MGVESKSNRSCNHRITSAVMYTGLGRIRSRARRDKPPVSQRYTAPHGKLSARATTGWAGVLRADSA